MSGSSAVYSPDDTHPSSEFGVIIDSLQGCSGWHSDQIANTRPKLREVHFPDGKCSMSSSLKRATVSIPVIQNMFLTYSLDPCRKCRVNPQSENA